MPYFFGSSVLDHSGDRGLPFGRAARYLEHARQTHAAYAALCSDATTLARTNLRYAREGGVPRYSVPSLVVDAAAADRIDGTESATCEAWAAAATAEARREAAARLATRPAAVAGFARRCARQMACVTNPELEGDAHTESGDDDEEEEEEAEAAAVDAALRAVASLLLLPTTPCSDAAALADEARSMAGAIRNEYGARGAAVAADALAALSVNVGVPRDMGMAAARALRSHAHMVADTLDRPRARRALVVLRGGFQGGGSAGRASMPTPPLLRPPARHATPAIAPRRLASPLCQLSSGLTFSDDAGMRLVSIQKPLGLALEQADEAASDSGVVVADVAAGSNAERAGVLAGDVLVAVNNLDLTEASLDAVVAAIGNVPGRAVNLRFQRPAV